MTVEAAIVVVSAVSTNRELCTTFEIGQVNLKGGGCGTFREELGG